MNTYVRLAACSCVRALAVVELMLTLAPCNADVRTNSQAGTVGARNVAPIRVAARTFRLAVPTDPKQGSEIPIIQLRKGDVVDLVLTSKIQGMATVHGLTDEASVSAGGTATIHLVANVIGRFALHFHGPGGTHTPVATLEIAPK